MALYSHMEKCTQPGRALSSTIAKPEFRNCDAPWSRTLATETSCIPHSSKGCSPSSKPMGMTSEGALRRIDEALALANETGGRWTEALLHRIRGEILLKHDPTNPGAAEEAFLTAIAIAHAQKARTFELQAALPLAQLYQSTSRPADANAVLAPALEGFSPTPEMPEIAEAQALLAALSETEEVKTIVAQHERGLGL